MKAAYRAAPLTVVLLAVLAPAGAEPQVDALRDANTAALRARGVDRALVVRDRLLPENPQQVSDLLLFCRQKAITAVFQATADLPGSGLLDAERFYRWREYLSRAHRQGLSVYALTGSPLWVYDLGPALRQIDAVLLFAERAAPAEGFDAIVFDFPLLSQLEAGYAPAESVVPPPAGLATHGTETPAPLPGQPAQGPLEGAGQAAGNAPAPNTGAIYLGRPTYPQQQVNPEDLQNAALIQQYLRALTTLKSYLEARARRPRPAFGVVVPAWLGTPLRWGPEVKPAVNHFADLADLLVLHNLPGPTVDIGRAAVDALRYSGPAGKRVYLRLELRYPSRPVPELVSLFEHDELLLESTILDLRALLEGTPGLAGLALDDYWSYRRLPARLAFPAPLVMPPPQPGVVGYGNR